MPMDFESPTKHNAEPAVISTSDLEAVSDVANERPMRKEASTLQSIPITQTHLSSGAANRRWLILMEPVNALHIDVILGRKVNASAIHNR